MKLPALIPLMVVVSLSTTVPSFAQKIDSRVESNEDTVETEQAKRARTDELYFEALTNKQHGDDRKAEALLKEFLAKRPGVAAAHYELSRIFSEQKKIEPAIGHIKKAMALDPDNKWYKETHAKILINAGNYTEAAKVYAALTKSEKLDSEYPSLAAEYFERADKHTEAIEYLDIALLRNIDDEDLMIRKMQIYLALNNVEKAAGVVQQLITTDPKNGKFYKLLGELYDNNKLTAKAGEVYDQAIKKLPNDAYVQLGLANHYLKSGDTAKYRIYVRKAITNKGLETESQLELLKAYIQSLPDDATALAEALPLIAQLSADEPTDPMILEYYGEALEGSNKPDSAILMYKKSLALKPSNFTVWGRLLVSYLDKPYADSLIKYSDKAMRLFPNQAITHFYNGIGYMNKNNFASAIKSMKRAIDLQPEEETERLAQMYSTLGDVYYSNKQFALSDQSFDKSLSLDPNDAGVLNNYSYYLSERGAKLDVAEQMSKKSLELRPNEPTYLDTYAWVLYKKGNYAKAKIVAEQAIEASKGFGAGTYYDHLGDILFKLNEKTKAIEAWKKGKEKGSDNKNLDKKISEGKLYE
jgi:tetratricopeptide (TPR) repeat protein